MDKTFDDLKLQKPALISVPTSTTIEKALQVLEKHRVSHLPLTLNGKLTSIVSLSDLVFYLIEDPIKRLHDSVENVLTLNTEDESYRILEKDYREPIRETLVAFANGAHRALLTDASNIKPSCILTQTDILKYLVTIAPNVPISDLVVKKPLKSITGNTTALQGFKKMKEFQVPSLPILENGKFIGNLVTKDLVGFKHVETLNVKATDFSKGFLAVEPKESLKDVMNKMLTSHHHRVWVLSDELGVVSQSDIISYFIQQ